MKDKTIKRKLERGKEMSADYYIVNINKKARLWFTCNFKASNLYGISHYSIGDEPTPLDEIKFKASYLKEFTGEIENVEAELYSILAFCSDHDVIMMNDNQDIPNEWYGFTTFDLNAKGEIIWKEWNDDAVWC